MNINELEKLIKIFNSSDLYKLKWRQDDSEFELERMLPNLKEVKASPSIELKNPPQVVKETAPNEDQVAADDNLHKIKAPFVGTFYRSPGPNQDAFVKVGSAVKKGSTLCIIEAMKLMNEIESDVDGTVSEILVDDANPVGFGSLLFLIKPD